jgi:hypothetical protein
MLQTGLQVVKHVGNDPLKDRNVAVSRCDNDADAAECRGN